MQLICDERERNGPLLFLPKLDWIVIETIHIGDYAVLYNGQIKYLFERKTWSDLASSLKDGRYEEQKKKLMEVDCMKYIIIEGNMKYEPDRIIGGIEFYKLEAAARGYIIDGIAVLHRKNAEHTADFLVEFCKQFDRSEIKSGGCGAEVIRIKRKLTTEEEVIKVWKSIKGIGEKILPTIQQFSISEFLNMTAEQIADLQYLSGRKLGIKIGQKIYNSFNSWKILASFPGLSDLAAKHIIKSYSVREFLTKYEWEIAEIQKSETRRIGPAVAERIYKLLNFKK